MDLKSASNVHVWGSARPAAAVGKTRGRGRRLDIMSSAIVLVWFGNKTLVLSSTSEPHSTSRVTQGTLETEERGQNQAGSQPRAH